MLKLYAGNEENTEFSREGSSLNTVEEPFQAFRAVIREYTVTAHSTI